jgi:hypothetical protein
MVQLSSTTLSLFVGVGVSFLSAVLVYTVRQIWERRKLHKALITEVEAMEGIKKCAEQMNRIDPPPNRQLSPDDVPAAGSIPTTVYRQSSSKIGLLGGPIRRKELKGVVKFYSKVNRYKSIIEKVGEGRGGQNEVRNSTERISPVSDSDQEDLYEQIPELSEVRDDIIDSGSFQAEYPDDIE